MASQFRQYSQQPAPQYQPRYDDRDSGGGGLIKLFTTEMKWNSPFIIMGMIVAFILFIIAFVMLMNRTVGVSENLLIMQRE